MQNMWLQEGKKRKYSEEIKKQAIKLYNGGKQWPSSRQDSGDWEKYVSALG